VTNKQEILTEALKAREEEVLHYQINIDNYRLAIEKSAGDQELEEFVARLKELLSSSLLEQKKAMIMLEVIREQIEE
jgi:hypothetical protein